MGIRALHAGWGIAFLALAASAASAQSPGPTATGDRPFGGGERWVPSFAVTSGVVGHQREARVESECERGGPPNPGTGTVPCFDPNQNTPFPLRPSDSGNDIAIDPYVGGVVEVLTPALGPIPGDPRLFLRGELLAFFPSERDVAKEGDPVGITGPTTSTGEPQANNTFPSAALQGSGSEVQSELQRFGYGAALGLAFPFRYRERWVWVKPSANWMRFGMDIEGRVIAGIKDDPNPPITGVFGENVREIFLDADQSETWDAIGGGIEFELETARYRSIGASIYFNAYAYRVLGDRTIELSRTATLTGSNLPTDVYSADWEHEIDPWFYRGGVGLRFHWLGN